MQMLNDGRNVNLSNSFGSLQNAVDNISKDNSDNVSSAILKLDSFFQNFKLTFNNGMENLKNELNPKLQFSGMETALSQLKTSIQDLTLKDFTMKSFEKFEKLSRNFDSKFEKFNRETLLKIENINSRISQFDVGFYDNLTSKVLDMNEKIKLLNQNGERTFALINESRKALDLTRNDTEDVKRFIVDLQQKLVIDNFENLVKCSQETLKASIETSFSTFWTNASQTLISSLNIGNEKKENFYSTISSSMLSLQNSINRVSHSKLVEYDQIKMDLNEFFQQLFVNLNFMMEQYSNRFHEIPLKLNIEENLLKFFDQTNFKQKVNFDENLSKKIENNFHALKEDFINHLQNLFTKIGDPLESYQRLQALITTNLETLWLKFEKFGSKNSDLLIEKFSNLNIQSQFLIQNTEKNAELMKMLNELVTQNSMRTNEGLAL
jgi:hypothetical protein